MINLKIIRDSGFAGGAAPPDALPPGPSRGKKKGGIKGGGRGNSGGGGPTITDTFVGTDHVALTGHVTDTGGKTWAAAPGIANVLSFYNNRASMFYALNGNEHRAVLDIGISNYVLDLDTMNGLSYAHTRVYLKYIDENNWVAFDRINTVRNYALFKKVAGAETQVDLVAGDPTNTGVNIRATVDGTSYSVINRDTQAALVSGTIADAVFLTNTKISLYAYQEYGMYYDNLAITPL